MLQEAAACLVQALVELLACGPVACQQLGGIPLPQARIDGAQQGAPGDADLGGGPGQARYQGVESLG